MLLHEGQVDPTLIPEGDRPVEEALAAAKLAAPFEHDAREYHTSQQAALNAQVRRKTELPLARWVERLAQLKQIVDYYPEDGAVIHAQVTAAAKEYYDVFRSTEDLRVTPQTVVDEAALTTSLEELEEMEMIPAVQVTRIRRYLDRLLSAPTSMLTTVEGPTPEEARCLKVYDEIARAEIAQQSPVPLQDEKGRVVKSGEVRPSTAALALHERFHYHPGSYAKEELAKMEGPMQEMEDMGRTARARKEAAIDANEPAEALRNLHAEVDLANNLLLLNKARLALVDLYGDDVREMRVAVEQLIEEAKEAAHVLLRRTADIQPRVAQDVQTMLRCVGEVQMELKQKEQERVDTEAAMQAALRDIEEGETQLWATLTGTLHALMESADRKTALVNARLSYRERLGREVAAGQERLKAQEAHLTRLNHTDELLHQWQRAVDLYAQYAATFAPKLMKRMVDIEDDEEALRQREAEDYVRRYEVFAYAAEEARAKRAVQVDRMRQVQRAADMAAECAAHTLDPGLEQYKKKHAEASEELAQAQSHVDYLLQIQQDRRTEVEPVLERVLRTHIASTTNTVTGLQPNEEITAEPVLLLEDEGVPPAETEAADVTKGEDDEDEKSQNCGREPPADVEVGEKKRSASPLSAPRPMTEGGASRPAAERGAPSPAEPVASATCQLTTGSDGAAVTATTDVTARAATAPQGANGGTVVGASADAEQKKVSDEAAKEDTTVAPAAAAVAEKKDFTGSVWSTVHSSLLFDGRLTSTGAVDSVSGGEGAAAHPYVAARLIGVAHESAYAEKHRQLTSEEQKAAETRMEGIRRSKVELANMAVRYQNADYIRSLLGADDR